MTKKKAVKAQRVIHPMDAAFGARVKEIREAHDPRITQTWLSRSLGVTIQQIQKYESGLNRVTVSRMFEIADALDVPVTELLKPLMVKKRR